MKSYNVDKYFVKTLSNPYTKHVKLLYYSDKIKRYLNDAMMFDRVIIIIIVHSLREMMVFIQSINTVS